MPHEYCCFVAGLPVAELTSGEDLVTVASPQISNSG